MTCILPMMSMLARVESTVPRWHRCYKNIGIDHGPIDSSRSVLENDLAGLGCVVNYDLIDRGRIDSCSDVVEMSAPAVADSTVA